ncbi:MAG: DUF2085 domain-containing protein [Methanomassiliicoccales archaeon]|nr:MAG: DUF2085 domain-containing protein [Methanomassiliicoccales archaeon]
MLPKMRPLERFKMTMGLIVLGLTIMMVLAPLTLAKGSVTDLSGKIGQVDNAAKYEEMNPFAAVIYYFGDMNCHQMDERTYSLNGNEMPICSRDLGIFIGLAAGLIFGLNTKYRPKFLHVIALAAPMAMDGGAQALTEYESFNELRLVTGLLGGLAIAFFLIMIASEMYEDRALPDSVS